MSGLILSGDVYIKRDGIDTGYIKLLNAQSFTVSVDEADKKTRKSKGRVNYGAVLDSYSVPGDHSVSVESDEFDKNTLAMAFLGTTTTTTHAAASTQTANVTLIEGEWVDFSGGAPVADVSITGLVEGTDFEVDAQAGLIMAIAGGAGAGAQNVDFDDVAASGYTVAGQTVATLRCEVLLVGENLTSGEKVRFTAGSATLSPSGDLDLLSDDFNTFTMSGLLEVPTGETSPYSMEIISY